MISDSEMADATHPTASNSDCSSQQGFRQCSDQNQPLCGSGNGLNMNNINHHINSNNHGSASSSAGGQYWTSVNVANVHGQSSISVPVGTLPIIAPISMCQDAEMLDDPQYQYAASSDGDGLGTPTPTRCLKGDQGGAVC